MVKIDEDKLDISWADITPALEATDGPVDIPTAFVSCLNNRGKVDLSYIAEAANTQDIKKVIKVLDGAIYLDPDRFNGDLTEGWVTSDEYLSGNIYLKLQSAKKAAKIFPAIFNRNVTALKNILPNKLDTDEIYVSLGSPWLPTDVIDDFIEYLLGKVRYPWFYSSAYIKSTKVYRDEKTGTWKIPDKNRYSLDASNIESSKVYGTSRLNALEIIQRTLNMKSVSVYDRKEVNGKEVRVLNKDETASAVEKQKTIVKAFQNWVWSDPKRKKQLLNIYYEKYGSIVKRQFDGSFLTFPNMSESVKLRDYQKNAVMRILFTKNTLLAHDVGAGKTYEMVAACMELRRMKLAKKPMIVVPNNIVMQWQSIFLEMYPNANILVVSQKIFTPNYRNRVLEDIHNNDYDAVIITYGSFGLIPFRETSNAPEHVSYYCFQDLGVDALFVDEAHNFKNLTINSGVDGVLGINASGSAKCNKMLKMVRVVQENDGRIVFATGTPITNSITDAYVMQTYLQPGELKLLNIERFADWVGMFSERKTAFEIDVDTSGYRLVSRFSRFHNLPELSNLLSSIVDLHSINKTNLPNFSGYKDILSPKNAVFSNYLHKISERADKIRSRLVSTSEDNMLKVTTDGRKAALDLRLVEPKAKFDPDSKAAKCADIVYKIYKDTEEKKSAQLIFIDTSTPKDRFNLYDEMKRLLVEKGIPPYRIAFVHDATTDKKRDALFAEVRSGDIRVLIGSTFKLGIGVNVQDHLIAIHHLDVPWRPADMVQREGRILREGNQNDAIEIYRYIREGSFDAYSWQLLETKQSFISQLLSDSLFIRDGDDIDEVVLDYAEVKALAVGNPLVKERVETMNEFNHLKLLQKNYITAKNHNIQELHDIPNRIKYEQEQLKIFTHDYEMYKNWSEKYTDDRKKELRKILFEVASNDRLQVVEDTLFQYKGFTIKAPTYMRKEKPYVIAYSPNNQYKVNIGNHESRELSHLEFFFSNMTKMIDNEKARIKSLNLREKKLTEDISKTDSYADQIEACQKRLKEIDKELDIDENQE